MKYDMVICGVGGQGGLSVATIIARAAMNRGLEIRQSEVHGMSQRGGAVSSNLRIADHPIYSDLIPHGSASLILSMEPLEALRYLELLDKSGKIVSASTPLVNITDYPPIEEVRAQIKRIPGSKLVDAENIARAEGSARAMNMVLLGAASLFLPLEAEELKRSIQEGFAKKGERIVEMNLRAFEAGQKF